MSTLFTRLQGHAESTPEKTAIWQRRFDGSYHPTTWADLALAARRFARAFAAETPATGILPLCLAKTPDCVAAMMGALAAGRAFACVNQKLRPPQIERILTDSQAPIALVDAPGLMALKPGLVADSTIARTTWWLIKDAGFGPTHERLANQLRAIATVHDWTPERWGDGDRPGPSDDPRAAGSCLFTSGSTGIPKGVLMGRGDLLDRAEAEVLWFGMTADDVLLSILPFSFDVGFNQLLAAMSVGSTLVILDSWFPKDILKAIETRQVTGISAVPTIWLDFMTAGLTFDRAGAHRSLRYLTVSGGDMSARHLEELPAVANGAGIFKTYGQSEAFRASSLKPHEFAARKQSVGRPFHGVRLYVVNEEGKSVAPNETGEIVHTGLGVMLGYLSGVDPQNKLRDNPFKGDGDPAEKAIFTGDLGRLDEEGYLFLAGRRDDMLKIQGNRVYPSEVRDQLLTIAGVSQAEVVAVKTDEVTRLAAFLVPAAEATLSPPAVKMQVAARAPSYMVPELIVVKSQLPRTPSGKPDRQTLAAEARELFASPTPAAR